MPQVKVWNDHDREHVEQFKGETLRIPAGGHILMDYIDAVDFKGQYFAPPGQKMMLGPNNPNPACFKKIRVDQPTEPVVKEDPNVFHATGKAMGSPQEVLAMAKALAAMNPELVAKDADLDKSASQKDAEIAALKAELAMLQQRKKPGPKPKERAVG